jgi:uncharacterized membrane protein YagU involved in acid resistance
MNGTSARSGLIAGLIATIVLSALMILKTAMGLMPQVNAIRMLTHMGAVYVHTPAVPVMGWIAHFVIGTILWGLIFAATYRAWPGAAGIVKGIEFSIVAWLLMMLIVMPLAGAGPFGLRLGLPAPVATLVLHIIYGAVLGVVYAKLRSGAASVKAAQGTGT